MSPIDTNDENPMPRAAASSIAAIPNPALCEAKPTSPGEGAAGAIVALRAISGRGLATPRQLGPTIRTPAARHAASSSSWRARPAGPTTSMPRRQDHKGAHALGGAGSRGVEDRVRGHGDHGELDLALDIGDRRDRLPLRHRSAAHVDEVQRPREPGSEQVAHHLPADGPAPAGRPHYRDGRRAQNVPHGRDVGLALALLVAPPRVPRQRRRELDLDRSLRPARGDQEPRFVEHSEHPVVARQDDCGERVYPCVRRGMGEMREQDGGEPVAVPGIGHRERDLRPPGRPADVGAVCDDRGLSQRDQGQATVGRRGAARCRVEVNAGAEEAKPARLDRQRLEEGAQPRHVLDRRRPHVHGRAVTEHDVGLSAHLDGRGAARHGSQTVGHARLHIGGVRPLPRVSVGASANHHRLALAAADAQRGETSVGGRALHLV